MSRLLQRRVRQPIAQGDEVGLHALNYADSFREPDERTRFARHVDLNGYCVGPHRETTNDALHVAVLRMCFDELVLQP